MESDPIYFVTWGCPRGRSRKKAPLNLSFLSLGISSQASCLRFLVQCEKWSLTLFIRAKTIETMSKSQDHLTMKYCRHLYKQFATNSQFFTKSHLLKTTSVLNQFRGNQFPTIECFSFMHYAKSFTILEANEF